MFDFARSIIVGFWNTAAEMSPYLLFGFFVAGILSVLVSQPLVERHLGDSQILNPVIDPPFEGFLRSLAKTNRLVPFQCPRDLSDLGFQLLQSLEGGELVVREGPERPVVEDALLDLVFGVG